MADARPSQCTIRFVCSSLCCIVLLLPNCPSNIPYHVPFLKDALVLTPLFYQIFLQSTYCTNCTKMGSVALQFSLKNHCFFYLYTLQLNNSAAYTTVEHNCPDTGAGQMVITLAPEIIVMGLFFTSRGCWYSMALVPGGCEYKRRGASVPTTRLASTGEEKKEVDCQSSLASTSRYCDEGAVHTRGSTCISCQDCGEGGECQTRIEGESPRRFRAVTKAQCGDE